MTDYKIPVTQTEIIGYHTGQLTTTSVRFWLGMKVLNLVGGRSVSDYQPEKGQVIIYKDKDYKTVAQKADLKKYKIRKYGWSVTHAGRWTRQVKGLTPNTSYWYKIVAEGKHIKGGSFTGKGKFKTAPPKNQREPFNVLIASCMKAMGSAAAGRDTVQKVWELIDNRFKNDLQLNVFLGDQHYANSKSRGKKWEDQSMQYKIKMFQPRLANGCTYTIYDNHDFLGRTSCGADTKCAERNGKKYSLREKASKNQHELWLTPKPNVNGKRREPHEGIYYKVNYGAVVFYMLDTRFFREQPGKNAALLGATQWKWLEDEFNLEENKNRVKIICMGSTIAISSKNHDLRSYTTEYEKFKNFISRQRKVMVWSGDIHRVKKCIHTDIKDADGKPLLEIISSGIGRADRNCFAVAEFFKNGAQTIVFKKYEQVKGATLKETELFVYI